MAIQDAAILEGLAALGAGEFRHLNGTLERHLITVHDLLRSWGASESLCVAGLYHAAYGTAGFDAAMVTPTQRTRIAALIGHDAEQIVYTYCSCDRRAVWPRIQGNGPIDLVDRFTGASRAIGGTELSSFCELTCANEVEIAVSDPSFLSGAGRHLGQLFARWDRHLSDAARQAVASAFHLS